MYRELEDYKKAKDILERAVNINVKHCGHGSVEVAITLHNLALAHGCLGEHEKAFEMLQRVLPVFEDHFGAHDDRCNDVRRAIDVFSLCACPDGHQSATVVGSHAQIVAFEELLQRDG